MLGGRYENILGIFKIDFNVFLNINEIANDSAYE